MVESLWPLDDDVAAGPTDRFYRLMPDTPSADDTPLVLHQVTRRLRTEHTGRPHLWGVTDPQRPVARTSPEPHDRDKGSTKHPSAPDGAPAGAWGATVEAPGTPHTVHDDAADMPPFTGGMVGCLGFDVVRRLAKRIADHARNDFHLPELSMLLTSGDAVLDHRSGAVLPRANAINCKPFGTGVDKALCIHSPSGKTRPDHPESLPRIVRRLRQLGSLPRRLTARCRFPCRGGKRVGDGPRAERRIVHRCHFATSQSVHR